MLCNNEQRHKDFWNEIGFQTWLHEISDFHYFMGHRGIKEDYGLFLEYRLPAPEWWMEIQMKG